MSTRSCIARIKGDGFEGVYHHWDGYPTALGKTLWNMAQKYLDGSEGGIPGMMALLIDKHPAGWSTINGADWAQEPGYSEHRDMGSDGPRSRPQCHCHGDMSEEANLVTHESDMGMEWAYVFSEGDGSGLGPTMAVLQRIRPDGKPAIGFFGTLGKSRETGEREDAWAIQAVIPLAGSEPDWEALETGDEE